MAHDFGNDHPADAVDLSDWATEVLAVLVRWGDYLDHLEFPRRQDYDDALAIILKALALAHIVGGVRQRLEELRDRLAAVRAALP